MSQTLPTLVSLALGSALLLFIGIILIVNNDIENRHTQRVTKVLDQYSQVMEKQIRQLNVIATNRFTLQALTETSALTKYLLRDYLSAMSSDSLRKATIRLVTLSGEVLASNISNENDTTITLATEPWFNPVFVRKVSFQSKGSAPIELVTPVIDADQVIGALITSFPSFDSLLQFNFEDSVVVITTTDQQVIYSTDTAKLPLFETLALENQKQWRVGYEVTNDDFVFIGLESRGLFLSEFLRLFLFALLPVSFIIISSLLSARAAGKLSAETIERFLNSLATVRKNGNLRELQSLDSDAIELKKLRQEFDSLLTSLSESNLSTERVSAMMNSLNDLLVVFDLNGKMILSNRAFDIFLTNTSFEPDNLIQTIFFGQQPEEVLDIEHPFTPVEKHYLSQNPHTSQRYFSVRWTRHRQFNDFGQVTGITFVGMDTTKSNELEAEIKLKEAAIDEADSGIIILEVIHEYSKIIYANRGAENFIGIAHEKIIGSTLSIFSSQHTDEKALSRIIEATSTGKSIVEVLERKRSNGSTFHLEISLSTVKLNTETQKHYYLGILKDVTEQQMTAQLLLEAKQKAEESAQIKSSFLASMSHEIRTPMNGVIGMLDILNESSLNEQQKNYVSIAQDSAESLLTIINDILDFSKVEAGKLTLDEIDFNLSDMLDGFVDSMAHQAHSKNLELVLDSSEINQVYVKGDPGRLRQIMTNLVGNAIKFTTRGEIVIHAKLNEFSEDQLWLDMTITDTGIGIPHEKQAHLFDPFTQVDGSHKRAQQGTGLGLAIVKQLCEAMHGHVWVNSEANRGSTFGFHIQLRPSDRSSPVLPPLNTKDKHVLLVDDNATNCKVLEKQLGKWGIEAESCASANDALALLSQYPDRFNAAIVDMNMPEMDGAAFGKRVSQMPQCKHMKLVLMTSISQRGDAQYFADLGYAGYFPKPATVTDIIDALSVLFDDGKALSEASPLVTQHYVRSLRREQSFSKAYRVLLVEDNPVNQMISKKYINTLGLTATVAQDGQVALDLLTKTDENFDLILMDCQMPVLDGFEATRKIRIGEAGDRYLNIPIIAMTANAMKGDRDRCLEVGMDDYISKPLRKDVLEQTLKSWLSRL